MVTVVVTTLDTDSYHYCWKYQPRHANKPCTVHKGFAYQATWTLERWQGGTMQSGASQPRYRLFIMLRGVLAGQNTHITWNRDGSLIFMDSTCHHLSVLQKPQDDGTSLVNLRRPPSPSSNGTERAGADRGKDVLHVDSHEGRKLADQVLTHTTHSL
jgi:hypothetical protein